MKLSLHIGIMLLAACTFTGKAHSVEPPQRLLVLELKAERGLDEGIVKLLNELILSHFQKSGRYQVFGSTDMQRMIELETERFKTTGCSDEKCMIEIGAALGADLLATSNIGKLGDSYLLNMKIIDVRRAEVVERTSQMVKGIENELAFAVESAVAEVSGQPKPARPIDVASVPEPTARPVATPAKDDAPVEDGSTRVIWGWVAAGSGVALAATGGVLMALGAKDMDKYNSGVVVDEGRQSGAASKYWAGVGLVGAGVVAAGIGTWLLISGYAAGDADIAVAPMVSPDVNGLSVAGRW